MIKYISKEIKSAIIGYYRSGASVISISKIVILSIGTVSEIINYYLKFGTHD